MKALFEQIGIDDQSKVDEDTIDFIYDFVDKHGGVEALRKDLATGGTWKLFHCSYNQPFTVEAFLIVLSTHW